MTTHNAGETGGAAVMRPGAAERSQDPATPPRQRRNRPWRRRPEPAVLGETAMLDRLRDHALGVADMTSTQVRAAELLLKRAEAADEPENHVVRKIISAEPMSQEEWERQYVR